MKLLSYEKTIFVLTVSQRKAEVPVPTKSNVGIRVKGTQNSNLEIRVKDAPKSNLEIRVKDAPSQIEEFLEQILGIRVRVRVQNPDINLKKIR